MEREGVLLDTSFLIRLLNGSDPLHENTVKYYEYFQEKEHILFVSTIAVAEYCVKGKVDELPFLHIRVLPFNLIHAVKAGEIAFTVFREKNQVDVQNRNVIPNDAKLFAQAETDPLIGYFATSDEACQNIYQLLKQQGVIQFELINIRKDFREYAGRLF